MVTARQKKDTTPAEDRVVAPEKENIEGNNPTYDDEGNIVRENENRSNLVKVKGVGLVPDYQANNVPSVGNDGPYLDEIQATEYRKYQDLREEQAKSQVESLKEAIDDAEPEAPHSTETDVEKMKRLRAEAREQQTVEVLQTIEAQKDSNNDGDKSGDGTGTAGSADGKDSGASSK